LLSVVAGCSDAEPDSGGTIRPLPRDSAEDIALSFDGTDDYATAGTAGLPYPEEPQTISLWLNHDSVMGVAAAIVLRKDFESGVAVGVREGLIGAWNPYGPRTFAERTEALPAGEWHHVAYVYDGGVHHLYLDGAEVATGDYAPTHRTPTSCWLGSLDGSRELYRGKLDEVRVWTMARSAAQIQAEYGGSKVSSDPGLVAYWSFNEQPGAHVIDRSGHGNHALLGDGIEPRLPTRFVSDSPIAQ
jgi:hypothetical protein